MNDDLISRQAAIDAIANCTNCGDEKTLRAYVAKHNLDNGCIKATTYTSR